MNNAEVLIKFKADDKEVDKTTKDIESKINGLSKSISIGVLGAKAVEYGLKVFDAGLESAIDRVDTLNNFPRVMSNLGISTEESAEVIQDLSKKLQGLPTSIDDAARAVQRFTSKNNNVKESEKVFLAVNNAILAGGASSQTQATALEQLSQAYAKGKPDMMEWRSIMTAMPAQLTQVAKTMGYVSSSDLGDAVRADEKEFARMIETMTLMNDQGIGGFKSFEEQARNATGGIGTSIKNMKTAFIRGVADILTAIDQALEPLGGIKGVLSSIGKVVEKAFHYVAIAIKEAGKALQVFGKWVKKNQAWLKPLIVTIAAFVATFKTITTIIAIITKIRTAISGMIATLKVLWAVMMANPIVAIIAAIAALVAGFVYLWNNCEDFRKFWENLWKGIKNTIDGFVSFFKNIPNMVSQIVDNIINFLSNIPYYIGYMIGWIVGEFIKFYTETVPNFISNIISWFASLPGKIWDIIVSIPGKIKDALISGIDTVKEGAKKIYNAVWDNVKKLPEKLKKIGEDLVKGLWKGIKSMKDWLWDKTKGFFGGFVDGIKDVLGIHSPSVVMEKQIGVNLGLGVVKGLDDTKKTLNSSIGNIASNITAGIGSNMTFSNSSRTQPIVNVYVDAKTDPLGQTVSRIKTFSGGAKNDYNYGVGV